MTRLSIELPQAYPRKFVWWMQCDVCDTTRSAPAWRQDDLPLSMFTTQGWECGRLKDTCPACIKLRDVEYLPPMWGLWLVDPSGKYGRHKVFAQTGETADEAFALAAARYRPVAGPIELDPDGRHFIINPARRRKTGDKE
jgi:hypothetical protein